MAINKEKLFKDAKKIMDGMPTMQMAESTRKNMIDRTMAEIKEQDDLLDEAFASGNDVLADTASARKTALEKKLAELQRRSGGDIRDIKGKEFSEDSKRFYRTIIAEWSADERERLKKAQPHIVALLELIAESEEEKQAALGLMSLWQSRVAPFIDGQNTALQTTMTDLSRNINPQNTTVNKIKNGDDNGIIH